METWMAVVATVVVLGVIFLVVKDGTGAVEQISDQFETGKSSEPVEWTPEMSTATSDPAEGWRITGWLLLIFGVVGLGIGLYMETSVETYRSAELAPYLPSSITNLDMLFKKGLTVAGGLFAIGAGIFCLGVGAIVKALGQAQAKSQ